MGRPQTIRDEVILAAAREVFLERGIRATTAEVAKRAGISPGSLFNRFASKEDLFFAAMEQNGPPPWVAALGSREPVPDLQADLYDIAHDGVTFFRAIVPLAMMMWSSGCGDRRKHGPGRAATQTIMLVAEYFERARRAGRMRADINPVTSAHLFCGTLHSFAVFEHLMGGQAFRATDQKVAEFVELFVLGAGAQGRAPKGASSARAAKRPSVRAAKSSDKRGKSPGSVVKRRTRS